MNLKIQCLTVDCENPEKLANWWAEVLGWKVTHDGEGSWIEKPLVEGNSDGYPDILFLKNPDKRVVKNRLHLDLRPDNQAAEVARLEAMGAVRTEIGQSADPG